MPTGVQVVQGIEDDVKLGEPVDVELTVLDVRVVGFEFCAGLKLLGDFFGDLRKRYSSISEEALYYNTIGLEVKAEGRGSCGGGCDVRRCDRRNQGTHPAGLDHDHN